jgi:hypothetical protein
VREKVFTPLPHLFQITIVPQTGELAWEMAFESIFDQGVGRLTHKGQPSSRKEALYGNISSQIG